MFCHRKISQLDSIRLNGTTLSWPDLLDFVLRRLVVRVVGGMPRSLHFIPISLVHTSDINPLFSQLQILRIAELPYNTQLATPPVSERDVLL